jgi:ribose-phosphate pyrophosphokinase
MDLHAGQIQGFFDIPTDNLYAAPVFALDIKHRMGDHDDLTVVSPDVGGVVRARDLAKRIGAGLAIVDKRRSGPGEIESMTVIGDVKDRTCVMVDDMCDTAGTLCKAAELLKDEGARPRRGRPRKVKPAEGEEPAAAAKKSEKADDTLA